jgi:hypothetical protein
MYGLPVGVDLSFFRARTLIQICVGGHDIIFNFDDTLSISVTSAIGYTASKDVYRRYEDFPQAMSHVVALLNGVVAAAKGASDGTLNIEFSNGARLDIFDDSQQFESYVIRHRDRLIVV